MEKNKTGKYLKYAIGEIILVVIGILIALQINIKNEERKDRNKEKIILETLLSDLKTNKELIEEGFIDYVDKINLSEEMANLFGKELNKENLVYFDSILYWSAEYTAIELINTSIISLATSDRLELLQNEMLKQQIVRYPTYTELYKEREDLVRSIVINEMRPNIEKHISLQKWWNIQESFKSDYFELINDRQLSNNYVNRLFQTKDAVDRLEKLKIANDSLISTITTELENHFN
jgi:hypothetical protein